MKSALLKKIFISLLALLSLFGMVQAVAQENPLTSERIDIAATPLKRIQTKLAECRKTLDQNRPDLLEKFDLFGKHLQKIYLANPSISERDILMMINAVAFSPEKNLLVVEGISSIHPDFDQALETLR